YTLNGETFRLGVYSHGPDTGGGSTPPPDSGWGSCTIKPLPAMTTMELEPIDFDTVRVHFTVPEPDDLDPDVDGAEITNVVLYYRQGEMALTDDNAGSAVQQVPAPEQCSGPLVPGQPAWCDVTELFGNYDYQIGISYED